jgi:5-methylcytosine-specific restriction enzyme subunit McrC
VISPTAIRISCVELRAEKEQLRKAAAAAGISLAELHGTLRAARDRLRHSLRIKHPITIGPQGIKATDWAGLIRLSPLVELEVAPKFLDAEEASWREDFFFIATLARTGAILPRERLRSSPADRGDLASLVGRAMIEMYWDNHRRPIRTYRRRAWRAFELEGDLDAEEFVLPDPDGFYQEGIALDRSNEYTATIRAAVRTLLPSVRNPGTRQQLMRVFEALSPQTNRSVRPARRLLPSRHSGWQPLYDLSRQILKGFGLGLSPEVLRAPGYVLKTWKAWEDVLLDALRTGLGTGSVIGKIPYPLGERNGTTFTVTPDVSLAWDNSPVLVDAKYKGSAVRTRRIGEADVYESLAFLEGAGAKRILLIYPRVPRGRQLLAPGTCEVFEKVTVGDRTILGLEVECRRISHVGFQAFSETLVDGLRPHL